MAVKLASYAASAIKRFKLPAIANIVTLIGYIMIGLIVRPAGAWYLVLIIMVADTLRFFAHGAWHHSYPHKTSHYHNPNKDMNAFFVSMVRVLGLCALIALALHRLMIYNHNFDYALWTALVWYVIVIATVVETFRCIIHTMHKHDANWLSGTKGRMGIPNWISIIRMPISLLSAHIYATGVLGEHSNLIATIIVIAAIGTDGMDGIIARATKSITKVGKYLDPLGDKLFFIPNAIALIFLIYHGHLPLTATWLMSVTLICFVIAVARDALFFAWFFLRGRKIKAGIGASMVDKIRMGAICVWLLSTAIAVSIDYKVATFMAYLSIISIIGTAILSVASFIIDYARVNRQLS